jgi:2-dehydro-3-deoxygalactonokinase
MHSPLVEPSLQKHSKAALIGVDWGTSNLRVMRIGEDGAILDIRTDQRGAARLAANAFQSVLREVAADWVSETKRVLVCGMAGARGKWRETGYRNCPVGLPEIAPVALDSEDIAIAIVPGVALSRGKALLDVMRGEETQVFGLPEKGHSGLVVTPGTHSKWVRLEHGRICGFRTFMTGELFAAVRAGTVLGEEMGDPQADMAAFQEGVEQGLSDRALTSTLFTVRTRRLSGLLPPASTADYLSGILIGAEIAAQDRQADEPITLVGPPDLNARYGIALGIAGITDVLAIDANTATARGLWRIHEAHSA